MPTPAKKEALKQLRRLEMMHPDASEASMVRTYLDWMLDVPWSKGTKDRLDLKVAKKVLDADHYGLDKVKERILEYLAVRKLNKATKGPILCFVGPPGVGKTSLGQSIARAMGRKFHRISLGGMRDVAGVVVVVNGKPRAVEWFSAPALYRKLEHKLLTSYVNEALDVAGGKQHPAPSKAQVQEFVATADKAQKTGEEKSGDAAVYDFENAQVEGQMVKPSPAKKAMHKSYFSR